MAEDVYDVRLTGNRGLSNRLPPRASEFEYPRTKPGLRAGKLKLDDDVRMNLNRGLPDRLTLRAPQLEYRQKKPQPRLLAGKLKLDQQTLNALKLLTHSKSTARSFAASGSSEVRGTSPYQRGTETVDETPVPELKGIASRRQAVMANLPGRIHLDENSPNTASEIKRAFKDSFVDHLPKDIGGERINTARLFRNYQNTLEQAALRNGLDPNFVKAIAWMEQTHGFYDEGFIGSGFEKIGKKNESIRPMNIHVQLWQDLGINRKSMMDIPTNIEAGAYILGQLWNKTEQPTIAKVATLYVKLGATEVNDYGRTVEKFYKTRPWEQITRVDQEK